MKIIAKSGPRAFLVECAAEELDALAGKQIGEDRDIGYNRHRFLELGVVLNICPAWKRLNRDQRRKDEVEMVRQSLQNIIAGLDAVGPFIEEPQPETSVESQP